MNHFNAALLSLVLIASAVNVLAAPTDDSEQYQISRSSQLKAHEFPSF